VRLIFYELPYIASAVHIGNQDDPSHWDLLVTLKDSGGFFAVQVKTFSRASLTLEAEHVRDWVGADLVTVPTWWDSHRRCLYWTDILRVVIRKGGIQQRRTVTVSSGQDLHQLVPGEPRSEAAFLSWITERCRLWHGLRGEGLRALLPEIEFPVGFLETVMTPELLLYLPLNRRLVNAMADHSAGLPRADLARRVLRAMPSAARSARDAAAQLVEACGLDARDRDLLGFVHGEVSSWLERVRSCGVGVSESTQGLWAFDALQGLIDTSSSRPLALPPFTYRYTYPMGRLAGTLPVEYLVKPLLELLRGDKDYRRLQYGAYLFGILPHRPETEPWREVRAARVRVSKSRRHIGKGWRLADRQMLYTEAQTGDAQAQTRFRALMQRPEVALFEAVYNFQYYEGQEAVIRDRYEKRLEEGWRTDSNTREIIGLCYNHLRRMHASDGTAPRSLDPSMWPADDSTSP
jgi:hypothetical protein